jgi:hypothetical protein
MAPNSTPVDIAAAIDGYHSELLDACEKANKTFAKIINSDGTTDYPDWVKSTLASLLTIVVCAILILSVSYSNLSSSKAISTRLPRCQLCSP